MFDPESVLAQAKKHIMTMEAEQAAKKLEDFERSMTTDGLKPDQVEKCSRILTKIQMLAAAAQAGVADARKQLVEILVLSRRFDSYDRDGKLTEQEVSSSRNTRY